MPSTFSTRLAVELQAAGENLNTWGDKANTVFKLLEEGVAGYAALTITGDTTLTITDGTESSGASNQARNAILKLTGSPAAFALTLPEVEKSWIIWNDTAVTATIKTSTATTTVALGASQIVTVVSDGAGNVTGVTPKMPDTGLDFDQSVGTGDDVEFNAVTTASATITALTAASLDYPSSDGAAGQYITTDGAGTLSFGTPSGAGDLLSTANLSDLTSASTARTNLGLAFGATAALSTQGEAETGTNNTALMTPLRTAEAIAAQVDGVANEYEEFLSSGTWTKPAGVTWVYVEAIGGGGGGGNTTGGGGTDRRPGGSGGEGLRTLFRASDLGATETIVIGSGGAGGASGAGSDGADGGATSFGSLLTARGGYGASDPTDYTSPAGAASNTTTNSLSGTMFSHSGHGGAGSSTDAARQGGNSIYGGGGGSGVEGLSTDLAGGVSTFAGNGGAGSQVASTKAGDGSVPGGGGGGSMADGGGGDGAAGRVRVWAW